MCLCVLDDKYLRLILKLTLNDIIDHTMENVTAKSEGIGVNLF